jgi:hypothetical protein
VISEDPWSFLAVVMEKYDIGLCPVPVTHLDYEHKVRRAIPNSIDLSGWMPCSDNHLISGKTNDKRDTDAEGHRGLRYRESTSESIFPT